MSDLYERILRWRESGLEFARKRWWLFPVPLVYAVGEHWFLGSILDWLREHKGVFSDALVLVLQHQAIFTTCIFAFAVAVLLVRDQVHAQRRRAAGWSNAVHMICLRNHDLIGADLAAAAPAVAATQFRDRLHELLVALALEAGRRADGSSRAPPRVAVLLRAGDGILFVRGPRYCTPHERFSRRNQFLDGQGLCWGAINAARARNAGEPQAIKYNTFAEMTAGGFRPGGSILRSAVLAPFFLSGGNVAGVLAVDSEKEGTFDDLDVLLVSVAASAIGSALRRFMGA